MSNAFDKASLVMLPHAYEEGKVYSLKPTDRSGDFTFSRGTDTATRVNASGNIEKETQNLLLQSNQFDTTWATANSPTLTSGQSGYDGSSDAWLLSKPAASFVNINQDISISGVVTYSVYLKAGTNSTAILRALGGTDNQFFIDLSNGTSTFASATIIDYVIEDVGSGWYRTSISVNDSGSVRFFIYPEAPFGNTTAGNIYIQDAQLNPGLVAYPYLETTTAPVYGGLTDDMPRLDYSGGATCPSLLLEPSRSNILPYSEYFQGWHSDSNVSYSVNDATSPEGLTNATKVTATSTSGAYFRHTTSTTAGKNTFSIFAKYDDCQYVCLRIGFFTGGDDGSVWFDIQNGVKGGSSGSTMEYDIEDYGNGWYRCYVVHNVDAADLTGYAFVFLTNVDGNTLVDNGTSAHFYGGQWEAGSYPTSYIPTYGSSQTRAIDDLISTPLSINELFGPTSGSIFMEFTSPLQGLNNNWFSMTGVAAGAPAYMRVRGYWQMNIAQLTWNPNPNLGSTNGATKIAVKWGDGVAKLFVDGQEDAASTYTGGDINMNGTLTGINGGFDFAENNANFKNIMFFQTALSDSECIALTTL